MFESSSKRLKNEFICLRRGVVQDLNDPEKLNRVKVMIIGDSMETPYANVMARFAGETYGTVFIPQKGEEVIVGFLNGKINDPVILGSVYNTKNKPPLEITEENEIMLIQFPGGLKLELNNKEDEQKLTITTKKGHIISLDDGSNEQLEINEQSAKTTFKIDFKNGEIELKAENKITLTAGQDSLTLENQNGVSISSSSGKLQADVNAVSLKAQTNVECEANSQFTAKGSAGAEVSSTGQTVLKGSMTKIN